MPFTELAIAKIVAKIIKIIVTTIAVFIRPSDGENQIPKVGIPPAKPAKPATPKAINREFFIAGK
jgi:hypothetical protein